MLGEGHRSPSLTIHHLPASARSQHDEHSTTHTAMSDMITIIIQITMATMNSYITLYNPAYAMSVLCSFLGCFSQRNRGFDSCSHRVAHASQSHPTTSNGNLTSIVSDTWEFCRYKQVWLVVSTHLNKCLGSSC